VISVLGERFVSWQFPSDECELGKWKMEMGSKELEWKTNCFCVFSLMEFWTWNFWDLGDLSLGT